MPVPGVEKSQMNAAELAQFTRQLGAMLDAGVDILRALRIASQHAGNHQLIEACRDAARKLEDGREFHQAIGQHPEIFDPFYVEMSRQGEADGILGKALLSVADYLDRSAKGEAGPSLSPEGSAPSVPTVFILVILGVQALGAAVIWSVAAAERLPIAWLGPLAALWASVCLLSGAWILHRLRRPAPVKMTPPEPLPPKTPERQTAETEAVVRNALLEQQDAQEAAALGNTDARPAQVHSPPASNGKKQEESPKAVDPSLFEPDSDPPRFQL